MLFDGFHEQTPDVDPEETDEWVQSFAAVVEERGKNRARFLIRRHRVISLYQHNRTR